ncbi:hypothetical protein L226DRAFT_222805 [Lentinus tigrinus ALCF2SS1-7]|uniref:uncharacterized protein n=1 Tax=Lentinus tigrinus ALCF2SS1-7 TaxID=1328758 RepID=UPI0011661224|nr:hypothetical protein L226DRAFT_222805 [Lentinus tigrinus ALCF2SS1-7]
MIAIRACVVFSDLLVTLLILRAVGLPWRTPGVSSRTSPVTVSLLKNSLAFFFLMCLINAAEIIPSAVQIQAPWAVALFFLSPSVQLPSISHVNNVLTDSKTRRLTSISITRMFIHLRQANRLLDDDFLSLFVRADMGQWHNSTSRVGVTPGMRTWSAAGQLDLELSPMHPAAVTVSPPWSSVRDSSQSPAR